MNFRGNRFHVSLSRGGVLRIYPTGPKTANGRGRRSDALYTRSTRNDDVCHRDVLYIPHTCGNPDAGCSHDDPGYSAF